MFWREIQKGDKIVGTWVFQKRSCVTSTLANMFLMYIDVIQEKLTKCPWNIDLYAKLFVFLE